MTNLLAFSLSTDHLEQVAAVLRNGQTTSVTGTTCPSQFAEQLTGSRFVAAVIELDEGRTFHRLIESIDEIAPSLPVVVVGHRGQESHVALALTKGAVTFVEWGQREWMLGTTVQNVVAMATHQDRDEFHERLAMPAGRLEFAIPGHSSWVVPMARYLQGLAAKTIDLPQASRVRFGISLEETLRDIVLHESLELSRTQRDNNPLEFVKQIERREQELEYNRRVVKAVLAWDEYSVSMSFEHEGQRSSLDAGEPSVDEFWNVSRRGSILLNYAADRAHIDRTGRKREFSKYREVAPAARQPADTQAIPRQESQAPHSPRGPHAGPSRSPRTVSTHR